MSNCKAKIGSGKPNLKAGQIIRLNYKGRDFESIIIDPDGLGKNQPTIGLGFRMMERYMGINHATLSNRWVVASEGVEWLKLPSGKTFRVVTSNGEDGNLYKVIEASDWTQIAVDLLVHPGRTSKNTLEKLGDFLNWFAAEGLYAQAYTAIKRVYSYDDSLALRRWREERELGKPRRKTYAEYIQEKSPNQQGYWTNVVYLELFNLKAAEMKEIWKLVAGKKTIARNYIPEAVGLKIVAYCEKWVVEMDLENLGECHQEAIRLARRKFARELKCGNES